MQRIAYILVFFTALFQAAAQAADSTTVEARAFELHEWGAVLGIGFVNENIKGDNYGPFLLMGNLEFHLKRKQRDPDSRHYFLLYAEPQLVPVLFRGGIKAWEAGLNIGARYLLQWGERNGLAFYAGSGPQYISLDMPAFPNKHFAFANNMGMSFERDFKRDVKIAVGYRYRYLANLNLSPSNSGIANHIFTIGFKKDFPRHLQQRKERLETPALIE